MEPINGAKSDNPGLDSGKMLPNFSEEKPLESAPEESLENIPWETIQEIAAPVIEGIGEAFKILVEKIAEAIQPIIEKIGAFFSDLNESLLHSVATPKEWHYYKHAKKGRTRKKYRNRLERRLARRLDAVAAELEAA